MIRKLRRYGSSLFQLVRSWWQVDRIRVGSSEGRLLRLTCGTFLCINDRRGEVTSRRVIQNADSPTVIYDLQFDVAVDRDSTLTVRCDHMSLQTIIVLREHGAVVDVYESEITVFG